MSDRWTKGPWQVSGVRIRESGQPFLQVGPDASYICLVCYSDRTPADHVASHADARLISAAPDMAEALEDARSTITNLMDIICADPGHDITAMLTAEAARRKIAAALAKARGQA